MGDYDELMAFGKTPAAAPLAADPYADLAAWKAAPEPEAESHFFPRSFSEAGQQLKDVGVDLYHGARRANDFATGLLTHPIDTGQQIADNPGASFREGMRGVNSNIPFANRAVEALGGPPAESPEDAAAAPRGLSDFSGVAAAPGVGKVLGGVGAKAIEGTAAGLRGAAAGVRAADRAIGAKAADIITAPPSAPGLAEKIARKGTERAIHAAVGGAVGGFPGMIASQLVSPYVHKATEAVGNKILGAVANRYLRQEGQAATAALGEELLRKAAEGSGRKVVENAHLPSLFGLDVEGQPPFPPRTTLAPLVHEPIPSPSELPPGFPRAPAVDEITGEPLTNAGQLTPPATNHATRGGATAVRPKLQILDDNGRDLLASEPGSLRSDVMRDVGRIRAEPPEGPAEPVKDVLGEQLANSVRLLDELRAGKITPKQAIDAGLPAGVVARAAR